MSLKQFSNIHQRRERLFLQNLQSHDSPLLPLQTAMDQLHMHFTQAIHNTVFQVVLGYVELCAGNADTKFQKMQYKDLCTVRWVWVVSFFHLDVPLPL